MRITNGQISFSDVSFGYADGQSVLRGISFAAAAGSKLALVGESGQGKSTIANLLCRFYETTAGQIEIDGQNIRDVTQQSLRQHIAVVFQSRPSLVAQFATTSPMDYPNPLKPISKSHRSRQCQICLRITGQTRDPDRRARR
ncbi:ATP-binding cassette domain-containing protein [bacterium]|nr:MAG: ATP-binding cassette domain-containing protein [bacterium]